MKNDVNPFVHIHASVIAEKITGYSCCCVDCKKCSYVKIDPTECYYQDVYNSVVEAFKEIRKEYPIQD